MVEIKDINEGDTVRIRGSIYTVENIEKSMWVLGKGIDLYELKLKFVEEDFGEKLANLASGD